MKYDGFFPFFCRFFITFVLMKHNMKRQFAAWILLSLFLPMLIFSSVHVHPSTARTDIQCAECIHHQPHHSHLFSSTICIHDCVLCQIFHLTFLFTASILIFYKPRRFHNLPLGYVSLHRLCAKRPDSPRAPPFA